MDEITKKVYAENAQRRIDAKVKLFDSFGIAVERGELEQIEETLYHTIIEPSPALNFVPVDASYNPAVEVVSYKQATRTGIAKTVHGDGDDRPVVSNYVRKVTQDVHEGGAAYTYHVDSADRRALSGFDEVMEDAKAAALAIAEWHDAVCFNGNAIDGVTGFANNASVTEAVDTTQTWTLGTTSGADIFQDIAFLINKVLEDSKGAHKASHVLMPINVWNGLSITRFDTNSPFTVFEKLRANYPQIAFEMWPDLATAGTSSASRVIAYEKKPSNLVYKAPVLFDEDLPYRRNFKFEVAVRGRAAGVLIRNPLAVKYQDITVA